MRIIEKLTAKVTKSEPKVVTTRNLTDYMISDRIMFVPMYKGPRAYMKMCKKIQRDARRNFER